MFHINKRWRRPGEIRLLFRRQNDCLHPSIVTLQRIEAMMEHFHAVWKVLVVNGMQCATGVHICIVYTPGTQVTAIMNKKAIVDFNGKPSPYRIIFMLEWRGEFGMKNAHRTSATSWCEVDDDDFTPSLRA